MAIEPVTREERFLAAAGGRSVTTPEPITRKEQLLQGIIDAVKSGGATPDVIEGAVNDYLNANPVKPGATTEQAAQIEQNKNDIADLQTEVDELKESGGNDSGQNPALDTTLTQSGKAADAKATGDALSGKVGGIGITTIMRLTQSEYDALPEKDEATLYIIADAAQVEPDTGMVPYLHIAAPCDIDTGITPTVDTAVEVTFYDTDSKNNNGYIGSRKYQIAGQGQPWIGASIGNATFSVNVNNFSNTGVKNTFRLDKSGLYINGELAQAATTAPTFNPTTKLYLFLAWNTDEYKHLAPACWLDDAKFYGAKIWQGGELVRDIVPSVDSGGVACVYDKVSGTYLYKTATNTGTLTYGEEVDE